MMYEFKFNGNVFKVQIHYGYSYIHIIVSNAYDRVYRFKINWDKKYITLDQLVELIAVYFLDRVYLFETLQKSDKEYHTLWKSARRLGLTGQDNKGKFASEVLREQGLSIVQHSFNALDKHVQEAVITANLVVPSD